MAYSMTPPSLPISCSRGSSSSVAAHRTPPLPRGQSSVTRLSPSSSVPFCVDKGEDLTWKYSLSTSGIRRASPSSRSPSVAIVPNDPLRKLLASAGVSGHTVVGFEPAYIGGFQSSSSTTSADYTTPPAEAAVSSSTSRQNTSLPPKGLLSRALSSSSSSSKVGGLQFSTSLRVFAVVPFSAEE